MLPALTLTSSQGFSAWNMAFASSSRRCCPLARCGHLPLTCCRALRCHRSSGLYAPCALALLSNFLSYLLCCLSDFRGEAVGAPWTGPVRHGASCDAASLQARALAVATVPTALSKPIAHSKPTAHGKSVHQDQGTVQQTSASIVSCWKANPAAPDEDAWGGPYGKPCGHNEVSREKHLTSY
jgi:hypothetical protein